MTLTDHLIKLADAMPCGFVNADVARYAKQNELSLQALYNARRRAVIRRYLVATKTDSGTAYTKGAAKYALEDDTAQKESAYLKNFKRAAW